MSLINDALKKAGNNKINPRGGPPMQPVADEPKSGGGGGKGFTVFLICFILAGGAALGAWNYWNKKYKNGATGGPRTTNNAAAKPAAPNTNNNPIARAAAVFNKVLDRNTEGEQTATSIQQPATPGATKSPGATATKTTSPIVLKPKPKPVWIPGMPRVQAIIYREQDPTALIDGKTVRAGDRIGEVLILEIKKDTVMMKLKDETHEISVR